MIKVVTTNDGSSSLFREDLNEHYHSVHGALTESMHVFIKAGLKHSANNPVKIFEMGFGTGLNCFLSWKEREGRRVDYVTVESFPLSSEIIFSLDFEFLKDQQNRNLFDTIHEAEWNRTSEIDSGFFLTKLHLPLEKFQSEEKFDLIYYDAFAPEKQPELWTQDIFEKMFSILNSKGILVTYCAKGYVKRNMKAAGFNVTALPGPPGKREMTMATLI